MRNSTLTSKAFPFGQVRSHIAVIAVRSASAVCIFCSGLLDFHFLSFGPSRLDFYAVSSRVGHSIAHVQTVQARRCKKLTVRKAPVRRVYSKVYIVSAVLHKAEINSCCYDVKSKRKPNAFKMLQYLHFCQRHAKPPSFERESC